MIVTHESESQEDYFDEKKRRPKSLEAEKWNLANCSTYHSSFRCICEYRVTQFYAGRRLLIP